MKIYNIVIIGVGQIGSRHLQALKKLDFDVNVEVVGRSYDSLEISKSRYDELPKNNHIKSINYYNSMDLLSENIDIAIIATNSDVRKDIVYKLVMTKNVNNIILEKVTFPSTDDFIPILSLLKEKSIQSWVNCQQRTYEHYMNIKKSLILLKRISSMNI